MLEPWNIITKEKSGKFKKENKNKKSIHACIRKTKILTHVKF